MILKRAETVEEADQILKDPEIFGRIAEDGIDEHETPFDGNQCYMMMYENDIPIGVWCLYPVNSSTLNIHCNILKRYRKHSKEARRLIIEWFFSDAPRQYVKLNAEIPCIYKEVYYYTKGGGFRDEGINRSSIVKSGKIIDQWRLGLTREEAGAFLRGLKHAA